MNNADLKALTDKRAANIQKLNNYLNAGKTAEEKIVEKLITQIKNAEDKLSSAGIELTEKINDDGTFTTLSNNDCSKVAEPVEVIVLEEQTQETVSELTNIEQLVETDKIKSPKKGAPTKKLRDENTPSKPEITKIGVTIKETVKSKIDALADDNNMKPNEVVNDLLERVFDGKNFSVQIEKKEKTKVTSFNIPKQMDKAMTRISKATDVPKSEIFNKLLEEALKEFFK